MIKKNQGLSCPCNAVQINSKNDTNNDQEKQRTIFAMESEKLNEFGRIPELLIFDSTHENITKIKITNYEKLHK